MRVKRNIIEIDEALCDGCGLCATACSEGAIQIIDGKAKLVAEKYCDGLGACVGECPNHAIRIFEQEADEFDAEAVEEHLKTQRDTDKTQAETMECGCSSSYIQEFAASENLHLKGDAADVCNNNLSSSTCQDASQPVCQSSTMSYLTHWPVQIRLIPASAPFLKDAHLLVASDCTAVALANFQRDFIKGRVCMIGCPKFDDTNSYIKKFADIFKENTIKAITVLVMEVPCCQGLPGIIKKGMDLAGKDIPIKTMVISPRGNILKSTP